MSVTSVFTTRVYSLSTAFRDVPIAIAYSSALRLSDVGASHMNLDEDDDIR